MSLRIAQYPFITYILNKCGMLKKEQREFVQFFTKNNIQWADATKCIPLPDSSVEILYSSHMMEHLDRKEVESFLKEARRILCKNGIIRIVVPDLRKLIDKYLADGDSDAFIEKTGMAPKNPKTLIDRIGYCLTGERRHRWMYDGPAVVRLLVSMGFRDPRILPAGATMIPDPGDLNLSELAGQSIYTEAYNP
jgi:SAM-dependent methyltransferase